MFGHYRNILIAIGVVALLSALLLIELMPAQIDIPNPDVVAKADRNYQPGGINCRDGSPVPSGGLPQNAVDDCAEETERYRLQFNDLVQQTRAANAAEAQAYLGYKMSWLVLIGTFVGLFTLLVALLAALYARQAADAAKASLSHATEVAEAELRPWLQLTVVPVQFRLTEKEARVRYTVRLKNLGKLPATGVFVDGRIYDFESRAGIPEHFAAELRPKEGSVPRTVLPQGEIEVYVISRAERERLPVSGSGKEAHVRPVLAVRVVYEWGHPEKGRTYQSFLIVREGSPDDEHPKFLAINPDGETRRNFDVKQTQFDRIC